MGMYNHVRFEDKCESCGGTIEGFQSKPWNGEFGEARIVDPWSVAEFYSGCDKCGTFIKYLRKSNDFNDTEEWLKDYDRLVETNG